VSADRWVRCPYCLADAKAARAAEEARVVDMYGKVPVDEWMAVNAAFAAPFDEWSIGEHVREDWEIGLPYEADTCEALIRYRATCKTCGAWAEVDEYVPFTRGKP
jgi:hypothetical protein